MASKYWSNLKLVLDTLYSLQEVRWANWETNESMIEQNGRSPALTTKSIISGWGWCVINDAKLEHILEKEQTVRFADGRLILFLPPFEKDEREFVPVMSLEYTPGKEWMALRVGMFRLNENSRPCGFGFRLEAPTSCCAENGQESIHDYYHVQMITDIGYGPSFCLPEWWPCRQPAICIRANNPVDAMLNLILSLYGWDFYKDFLKSVKGRLNIELMRFPT